MTTREQYEKELRELSLCAGVFNGISTEREVLDAVEFEAEKAHPFSAITVNTIVFDGYWLMREWVRAIPAELKNDYNYGIFFDSLVNSNYRVILRDIWQSTYGSDKNPDGLSRLIEFCTEMQRQLFIGPLLETKMPTQAYLPDPSSHVTDHQLHFFSGSMVRYHYAIASTDRYYERRLNAIRNEPSGDDPRCEDRLSVMGLGPYK